MYRISDLEPTVLTSGRPTAASVAQLINRLYVGPGESSPEFDFFLTCVAEQLLKLSGSMGSSDGVTIIRSVIEEPEASRFDEDMVARSEIKFGAFYILVEYYLAVGDLEEGLAVLEEFKDEFGDRTLYKSLKGEVLRRSGGVENLTEALSIAIEVAEKNEGVPEAQHILASVIATILEREIGVVLTEANINSEESLLRKGRSSIERTVGLEPDYAKYRATYARILMLQGQFEEARRELWRAIRLVDPRRPSHERIMAEYRIQLSVTDIQTQQEEIKEEAQNQLNKIDRKVDEVTSRYEERILQFLTFFAGLIAVAVSATQIVASVQPFQQAARLVLVFSGGLLVAFGGFSLILPSAGEGAYKRSIAVIACGFALAIVGIFVT